MKFAVAVFLGVPILLAGCASRPPTVKSAASQKPGAASVPLTNVIKGAPEWVTRGNIARDRQDARVFLAVGKAERMGDMAMQKAVADDSARLEVERVLSVYFEELLARHAARSRTAATDIARINQLNNTSKAVMATVRIASSWRDNNTGAVWSLAELDVGQISKMSALSAELDAEMKSLVLESSVTYFDRFLKENK